MKVMKKILCLILTSVLVFGMTLPTQAATKKNISRKNAVKIVNDITEYLTEDCTYGEGGEVKFNSYHKTQMACKLCKPYKLSEKNKKTIKLSKDQKDVEFSYLKEAEIKKNMKNLFGTTKFKLIQTSGIIGWDAFEAKGKGKNPNKILVMSPGGNFRVTKQKYGARNIKITGKTTKKVKFDVGWYYGIDKDGNKCWGNDKFWKGGTYTITLKPANNKYGCIITNLKENWREPRNSYVG